MELNRVTIASLILAIFMASAVLLINDPDPTTYNHILISEQIINKGANFCLSCP